MTGPSSVVRGIRTMLLACLVPMAPLLASPVKTTVPPNWQGAQAFQIERIWAVDGCDGLLVRSQQMLYRRDCGSGELTLRGSLPATLVVVASGNTLYAFGNGAMSRSDNGGSSFATVPTTGYPSSPSHAARAPNGDLFVATGIAVYRLPAGASAWSPVFSTTGISVQSLAVDAMNRIYLADYDFKVHVSRNLGQTWEVSGAPGFAFPTTPGKLAADAAGNVYVGTYFSGVYKSGDGGATWNEASVGLPAFRGVSDFAFAGGMVFALAADQMGVAGVYASADGVTWSAIGADLGAWTLNELHSIGAQSDGTVYAGTRYRGILSKAPGGAGLIQSAPPLPHHATAIEVALDGTVFAMSGSTGAAPGGSYGMWRQAAGNGTWTTAEQGIVDPYTTLKDLAIDRDGRLFVSTYNNGIFVSADSAQSWVRKTENLGGVFTTGALEATADGRVVTGQYFNGSYQSLDDGDTWQAANDGLPGQPGADYAGIALLAASGATVYGVASDQMQYYGLYRRIGASGAWSHLPAAPANIIALHATFDGRLFASTSLMTTRQTHASTDGGATWEPISVLQGARVVDFASSAEGRTVVAATDRGVHVQDTPGSTWRQLSSSGLPSQVVTAVAIGNDGDLYAGVGNGVYVAQDYLTIADSADVRVTASVLPPNKQTHGLAAPTGAPAPIVYRVTVFNAGPKPVSGVAVEIPAAAGVSRYDWTCNAPSSGCMPASGGGTSVSTTLALAVGATAIIDVSVAVGADAGFLSVAARAVLPGNVIALNSAAERSTTVEISGPAAVFRGGFEP